GSESLVQEDVLVPEHDVVGCERLAIRPLRALAEVEHELRRVLVDLVRLGEVGDDTGPVHVPVDEVLVRHGAYQPWGVCAANEAHPPGAAVLADPVDWLDDPGRDWQPLHYGWNLARRYALGQLRRFVVVRLSGSHGEQREEQKGEHGRTGPRPPALDPTTGVVSHPSGTPSRS